MYDSAKIDLPKGFDNEADFVKWIRETFEKDLAADQDNRDAAIEDIEFMSSDQWDEADKQYRLDHRLPVLTVNQLPAFVSTVVGNRRLNDITIRVSPDNLASRGIANLREGVIRNVLKNSAAKRALDKAYENEVMCGIGNFGVGLEYARGDVFDQDICLYSIPHALAVVWDRFSIDPTGRDAKHCFIAEQVQKDEYEARWPKSTGGDFGSEVDAWAKAHQWISEEDRRVLTVWRMNEKTKRLAMFTNGAVLDITDWDDDKVRAAQVPQQPQMNPQTGQPVGPPPPSIVVDPKTQMPMIRNAPVYFAQRWVVSAGEILEGPYELPIDRVPIFRCTGWEVNIATRRSRWGLIRLAKDPQRLFNFWRSVVAEKLLYAPKATIMGPASAFEGRMSDWRDAHVKREPLVYNDDAQAPEFIPPPQPDVALLQQASMALQDMRDVLNLHEASLGLVSNEVSAKAINERRKIGEIGTAIFDDNMNDAIEEAAHVINQLIPVAIDTPRTIKIVGLDDKEVLQAVNSGENDDITLGQYSITLTTGPSSVTKRAEAAEAMLTFVNAAPQTAAVAPDLIVEAQDWPNAEAIAARFRRALPPNLLGPDELTPDQVQAAQQQQMLQMHAMKQDSDAKEAATAKDRAAAVHSLAMASEARERALHARAQASSALANADTQRMDVVANLIDKEHQRIADNQNQHADRLAELAKADMQATVQRDRVQGARQRIQERNSGE